VFTKHIPAWVLSGGAILSACAGSINAVGFMGVHHRALSHLSGPITMLSTDIAAGDLPLILHAFLVILAFFFGCVISGYVIRQSTLKLGRRYGFILMLEAVLLVAAVHYLKQAAIAGDCLGAMACGLQNSLATSYSGAVIRTTHMTGIVTDLGIAFGHLLRGHRIELVRIRLLATLLAGFFIGGILGALSYEKIGYDTLFVPAAITGISGFAYMVYKHIARRREANAFTPST
jgi:uncharacterized membrane protein YoaK (UPF0700 family)